MNIGTQNCILENTNIHIKNRNSGFLIKCNICLVCKSYGLVKSELSVQMGAIFTWFIKMHKAILKIKYSKKL